MIKKLNEIQYNKYGGKNMQSQNQNSYSYNFLYSLSILHYHIFVI